MPRLRSARRSPTKGGPGRRALLELRCPCGAASLPAGGVLQPAALCWRGEGGAGARSCCCSCCGCWRPGRQRGAGVPSCIARELRWISLCWMWGGKTTWEVGKVSIEVVSVVVIISHRMLDCAFCKFGSG